MRPTPKVLVDSDGSFTPDIKYTDLLEYSFIFHYRENSEFMSSKTLIGLAFIYKIGRAHV